MDPIEPGSPLSTDQRTFIDILRLRITGEVDSSTGTRARYSTDAGNYRIPPLAVVFPQHVDDVLIALECARTHQIPVTSRGGGTSCAGNAIGPGIVIDFTRHMNRVLHIDPENRTAIVEPGCIQTTLQAAAAPYGLRFGPDPSSHNRASIGGMVGNNACGPHATAWGRTADNVISLDCIDGHGRRFTAHTSHASDIPEVPGLAQLIDSHLAIIRRELGTFGRQVSGYSLEHLTPEKRRNLAAMLVGTEGTLVTILSVTVALVPVPTAPVLVALGYADMIQAADDVPTVLAHKPLAVEGMDARLVDVVRQHRGPGAVPELPEGTGWLLCEVGGENPEDSLARAHALAADAHTHATAIYPPGTQASALWRIRADGAGLGGRTPYDSLTGKGGEQAWPGFEDAAVPPARLGSYLRDFTALMQRYGIDGLLYGHFGDGCVHVRLNMPLADEAGVAHSRCFLEESAALCASHGGSVSGEHGDGRARSELLRFMYSPDLLDLFAQVKHLFDSQNLLNPGVLTAPMDKAHASQRLHARTHAASVEQARNLHPDIDPLDRYLRRPKARPILADNGFAFREDHGDFTQAIHRCTGVGKCRADISGSFMCPSYQASRHEKDVTRGRARILQDAANGQLIARIDSPEVLEALDLCLACKACSSDCPAGVDMAKYRSEVLFRRYRGRMRPLSHWTLGWLPRWTRLSARVPGLAAISNMVMKNNLIRRSIFSLIGLDTRRPMPSLQSGTFTRWARRRGLDSCVPQVEHASADEGQEVSQSDYCGEAQSYVRASRFVVVWADSFSQTLDDAGARAVVSVLEAQGFHVIIPEDACCGLTWITTGQLTGAKKRLTHLLGVLAPFAANGIPIVGVEPSCTAVLRDDLLDLLPDDPRSALVSGAVKTLAEVLTHIPKAERRLPDLSGIEVIAQPHCHHYSVMGWSHDRELLESLGAQVTIMEGCCGLAGNFGMERGHYDMSVAVAEHSLLPTLRSHPQAVYLADGFSCRTQAQQLAGRGGIHLAHLLAQGFQKTAST
ncbi:FAD-binding and (Fe-S)-binding domain-containing protein [Schaalia sp. lx-100]|uniref:FAD-binding and (Fe-S)-binding domain-containing protein n=1 Tax=Schaalia sp. lx-100 TaxID=2899081 RepID=UPI001E4CED04|nr:FAD-binding and (Fe-S)-binding domain-containing protein [Schaalia sp. lx-100]MCD4557656.1 FAD-binding oxidoreductase [Schaalia sp. lx-100]